MSEKRLSELSRAERADQRPIVPGLPAAPGIRVAMQLTPAIGKHLRGLADAVLVDEFPGATIDRYERELLATAVSAANGCFFCADSHAAHACAVAQKDPGSAATETTAAKEGTFADYPEKIRRLAAVALNVQGLIHDYDVESAAVTAALDAGATPEDVQLTVAIGATFSMYNRFVEGFRAMTPANVSAYDERAAVVAQQGYALPSDRT